MKLTKVVALALVLSVLQLSVVAAAPSNAPAPTLLTGTLLLRGTARASVNGTEVGTGTTVLSGSAIGTGDAAGAVVNLAGLGRLEVMPSSVLTLTFDRESVTVLVSKGDAALTTAEGVKGTVVRPEGEAGPPQGGGQGQGQGGRGRIFGLRRALFVTLLAGAAGAVVIAALLADDNPSPSQP